MRMILVTHTAVLPCRLPTFGAIYLTPSLPPRSPTGAKDKSFVGECVEDTQGSENACCECVDDFATRLLTGTNCVEGTEVAKTIETLELRPGFYRYNRRSLQVLECSSPAWCTPEYTSTGNSSYNATDEYCAPAHQGILCRSCMVARIVVVGWVVGWPAGPVGRWVGEWMGYG